MNDTSYSSVDLDFKVNEIICLENQNTCLYGEVIQILPSRGLCWFRPMCLVVSDAGNSSFEPKQSIDQRSGSDLLWPIDLFRAALDTEVVGFLTQLSDRDRLVANKISSRQCLNKFLQQVWQDNQDKFPTQK